MDGEKVELVSEQGALLLNLVDLWQIFNKKVGNNNYQLSLFNRGI